jgi:hypothetical protein
MLLLLLLLLLLLRLTAFLQMLHLDIGPEGMDVVRLILRLGDNVKKEYYELIVT